MKRAALVVLVALVAAAPAVAGLPVISGGSVVGEGVPLKAYASLSPTVHLFGDAVTANLSIVADTKWVDPSRLRVRASFSPYVAVADPTVARVRVGRFAELTWTWTLRCLDPQCVPREPPSDHYHVFHFPSAHIDYLAAHSVKTQYGIDATWPPVEVVSQVSPGVAAVLAKTNHLKWQFHMTPIAAPTWRISPMLLFWLAIGLGGALVLVAGALARRWWLTLHPPVGAAAGGPTTSPLERAVALLLWAHERGDETLERKALERVAGELNVEAPVAEVDALSRTARELAWSSDAPGEEVETFAAQARDTGRQTESDDESQPEAEG